MRWLFVQQPRPFVLLSGAASLVLNVALLGPAPYMVQVFDRVFSSRSVDSERVVDAEQLTHALGMILGLPVDAAALKDRPEIRLHAGMPAEVFVTTAERTLFEYLVKPLGTFASRATREP